MTTEQAIAAFVCDARLDEVPADALEIVRLELLGVLGTTIAGVAAEGCQTIVDGVRELAGKPEATILVHGDKVPAQSAAFVNAVLARSLDFEDSMAPGAHPGASVVAAALAAAELAGGASGADFLAAVAVGTELAVRLNLGEPQYDGFDPTGVCVPFGAAAAAARILGLSEEQTWNALALVFCRCGGSFQANVDGALAVRIIQGWVAEAGVACARFAQRGITGPRNFLGGIYGYFHLFGRDQVDVATVLSGLGAEYRVDRLVFKKYPSCGGTQSTTDLVLGLVREEGLQADDVESVEIRIVPYLFRLVGHPFELGGNPRVNAQFSVRYCAASALVRKAATLAHFEAGAIGDPAVLRLVEKIDVIPDAALDALGHAAAEVRVVTTSGREYFRKTAVGPGFPGNPLSKEEHVQRFWDCIDFAADPAFDRTRGEQIVETLDHLEKLEDVRTLISMLTRGGTR